MIKLSRMWREIVLKKDAVSRIRKGYLWVTKKDVLSVPSDLEKGEIVKFVVSGGTFVAMGYCNPDSYILGRIYSYSIHDLDEELVESYLMKALSYREKLRLDSNAYRIFFSESDGIPGIIIDRYLDGVVFQVLTHGIERKKEVFLKVIDKLLKPSFIVERRDAPGRQFEGLEVGDPVIHKGADVVGDGFILIEENGLKFFVDILKGHKTGHYLDQRENRKIVAGFAKERRVLDAFCNTGGFAVTCASYGASSVVAIDISERVIEIAKRNAELNGVSDKITWVKGDVFDELRNLYRSKERFDLVVLDPPSFTKSVKTIESAVKGYFDINLFGVKLLRKGGILATASCSHHFTLDRFLDVLSKALQVADRRGRILEIRFQAMDHPILPSMPETLYLKLVIMEVY
ncbi:MAG: class I SAM-dependent rRNA methyltransferase [Thermosulfidibacteraceae bacterium]